MRSINPNKNLTGVRTWIEVGRGMLAHNYRTFRTLVGTRCCLMAVAKSNAYGHGLWEYAREMETCGVDWFGVDSITEALTLREKGIRKPLLVLGYTLPERFADAAERNISVTISTFENMRALKKLAWKAPLNIHIKIDTGMHRQGFVAGDVPRALRMLKMMGKGIVAEGIYTHFASAKNPAFPADTLSQIAQFENATRLFHRAGFHPLRHASATSGALLFPGSHYDMVRVGIGLYGLWPSSETHAALKARIHLEPALSWKTIIGEIKRVGAGNRIGYDLTETLVRTSRIAVCPVGYWHGYPRALSGVGQVLVHGKRAKVLGRVSMDMLTIDVTGIPKAQVGDTVTLIGRDGHEEIRADELAGLAGTTNYEIVTRLNPLIKKIYR